MGNRIGVPEAIKVRKVLDDLIGSASPLKSMETLVRRSNHPDTPEFERYAGLVFRDAGVYKLLSLAQPLSLHVIEPHDGKLARLVCHGKPDSETKTLISALESALNRLIGISDALQDGFMPGTGAQEPERIGISILGSGYLPVHPGYRTAYVELPQFTPSTRATCAYYNEVDWRVIDNVASTGHTIFQNCILPNSSQSILGAWAPNGSDWDVRTRMASMLEGLELPFDMPYRYDCAIEENAACVRFTLPSLAALPQRAVDKSTNALTVLEGERLEKANMVYAIRLACLIGAVCFGAGRTIGKAYVSACFETGNTALSCEFDRKEFVHNVLTLIDSGRLADQHMRFEPDSLAQMISCATLQFAHPWNGETHIELDADHLSAFERIDVFEDGRLLPKDMQTLFRAQRICDIDTTTYFGPNSGQIDEARLDSEESVMAAIVRLENVVDELEFDLHPPGDDANSRPLFCNNPYSRLMVSLLDDMASVSFEAEAYLHGSYDDDAVAPKAPSYFRAPSALFHAHMGLSDLYERIGDLRGAESESDRCIELAPSTAQAHYRKAYLLAQQGKYEEASNVLLFALPFAISEKDCALLYYHLGLLFWNLGRKTDAAAIYVYTASLAGEFAEKAEKIVAGLKKRDDVGVIVHASPLAAAREMTRSRIPLSPSETGYSLLARATVGLSCANAPNAAAPYGHLLMRRFHSDNVIVAALRSLEIGIMA